MRTTQLSQIEANALRHLVALMHEADLFSVAYGISCQKIQSFQDYIQSTETSIKEAITECFEPMQAREIIYFYNTFYLLIRDNGALMIWQREKVYQSFLHAQKVLETIQRERQVRGL